MKKLRVTWDMTFSARSAGGTDVYARNLFSALQAPGVIELQEIKCAHTAGPQRVEKFSGPAKNLWWLWRGLEQTLDAQRPDLFHAAAFLGPRRAPCPLVVNVFDVVYEIFPREFDWKWKFYARTVIPHTVHRADAVITLSEYARGEIVRVYDVPRARVHIVPPGIRHEFRADLDAAAIAERRARYNLPENYLLHIGSVEGRKNIRALLGALAQVRAEFPDLFLVLGGPRVHTSEAVQRARREFNVDDRVRSLSFIPQTDLPCVYAGARAFVYASKMEGFGIPPVEALACGIPVISAPNPPMPQVLGDAGYFAQDDSPAALAQAIRTVLRDQALTRALREKGIARAREFTWEGAARAMIQIYQTVLQDGLHQ